MVDTSGVKAFLTLLVTKKRPHLEDHYYDRQISFASRSEPQTRHLLREDAYFSTPYEPQGHVLSHLEDEGPQHEP